MKGAFVMMPTPTHLKGITKNLTNEDAIFFGLEGRYNESIKDGYEYSFIGKIVCTCGNQCLEYLQPYEETGSNYIKVKCIECQQEYLIFDTDFHGWDGWICHDEEMATEVRPKIEVFKCTDCENELHEVVVIIDSQGKQDFIDEAGEDFDLSRWQDAFEWITIDIKCCNCGKVTKEIVSYETM